MAEDIYLEWRAKMNSWKTFAISDIFTEFEKGKCSNATKLVSSDTSGIPYIGAKFTDGGVIKFSKNENDLAMEGNGVVFINSGDGSGGLALYKKEKIIGSTGVSIGRNSKLNKYHFMFIATSVCQNASKYGFGYGRTDNRLKRDKILLPTNKHGNPDWSRIEKHMRNVETKILKQYEKHLKALKRSKKNIKNKPLWKEFIIADVFDINPGKRLTKADMKKGKKPFIGASDSNNGLTAFVSNTNESQDKNVLGVNYNGSVVENFYHPYQAVFSDDVKRFKIKKKEGNKYLYLFLKQAILKQKEKYRYGYKFNEARMQKQILLLPVTKSGTPDYEYMKTIMRDIELKQLLRYVQYLKNLS